MNIYDVGLKAGVPSVGTFCAKGPLSLFMFLKLTEGIDLYDEFRVVMGRGDNHVNAGTKP